MDDLAENLRRFTRVAISVAGRHAAAVAIALSGSDGETAIWLTRRTPKLRTHPGQFALPGGRLDTGEDAVAAALRELREELGATACISSARWPCTAGTPASRTWNSQCSHGGNDGQSYIKPPSTRSSTPVRNAG